MGLSGVEPLTSRLSGVRSNQLSYRPERVNCSQLMASCQQGGIDDRDDVIEDLKEVMDAVIGIKNAGLDLILNVTGTIWC